MALKHRPPAKHRKGKKSVLAQYAAFYLDEGYKLLEQTLDLLVQCMFCCQCTF